MKTNEYNLVINEVRQEIVSKVFKGPATRSRLCECVLCRKVLTVFKMTAD